MLCCPHAEAMATKISGWLKEFFTIYLYIVLDFFSFLSRQTEQRLKKNPLSDDIKTASLNTQLHISSISNCQRALFQNVKDF